MAVLPHKCPHCGLADAAFQTFGTKIWPQNTWTSDRAANGAIIRHYMFFSIAAMCPRCSKPIGATLQSNGASGDGNSYVKALSNADFTIEAAGLKVLDIWPKPPEPRIPAHLDPRVTRALLQAERNFAVEGNEEAAGMMYRRALEVALDLKYPDVSGMLAAKIKKLVQSGDLTDDLGEWADHIRELGNDAAHEDAPLDRADLTAMREFTDAALRYAVSLPEEIKARKAANSPPPADDAPSA